MKELHRFFKVFIFVQLGAFTARVFQVYNDYSRHRELYESQSAPWYTDIILTAILTAITVSITIIAYFIIGHIIKKRNQEQNDDVINE